jgi:hypothetical protein
LNVVERKESQGSEDADDAPNIAERNGEGAGRSELRKVLNQCMRVINKCRWKILNSLEANDSKQQQQQIKVTIYLLKAEKERKKDHTLHTHTQKKKKKKQRGQRVK